MEAKDTAQQKLDATKASLPSKQESWRNQAEQWKENAKASLSNASAELREDAQYWKDAAKEKWVISSYDMDIVR